ncbi:hypothetical protein BT93_E0793 [Corymbia citriodora subsp. variegata]|nr:hypothetical protein BT93_E0793 [Corymbia citriodora subsp. variegata]
MAASSMARPVPATRSRLAQNGGEAAPGVVEAVSSFDRMGLSDDILRGIYGHGFDKPSAIRQQAVVSIVRGRDVIAQAQSGTGKTSTFALASCQIVDTSTREYARSSYLSKDPSDEADEMLSRGFKDQINDVYRFLPPELEVVLVSATLPTEILEMKGRFMTDPIRIVVKRDEMMLEWKEQSGNLTLCDIYDNCPISQGVVFCNTKRKVEWLAEKMRDSNFTVSFMHGDMPQRERDAVMAEFRYGATQLMITTDVWARGIDVEQVCLIVNYDLPNNRELYVHQAGRVGRFGRKGAVVNFVKDNEIQILRDIEQYYGTNILECPEDPADII